VSAWRVSYLNMVHRLSEFAPYFILYCIYGYAFTDITMFILLLQIYKYMKNQSFSYLISVDYYSLNYSQFFFDLAYNNRKYCLFIPIYNICSAFVNYVVSNHIISLMRPLARLSFCLLI
jgi:hypothetical protein